MEGGPDARARMVLNCIKNLKHLVNVIYRFFEKFNMLLPSMKWGITASEIGYYGPIFLAKFGRFYR